MLKGAGGAGACSQLFKALKYKYFVRGSDKATEKHQRYFKQLASLGGGAIHYITEDSAWQDVLRKCPANCRWVCEENEAAGFQEKLKVRVQIIS